MGHYDDVIEEGEIKREKVEKEAQPLAKIPDRRGRIVSYGDSLNGYTATFHKTPERRRKNNDRRRDIRRKE